MPGPPQETTSFAPKAKTLSLPPRTTITSRPGEAVRTSLPSVPRMVAGMPLQVAGAPLGRVGVDRWDCACGAGGEVRVLGHVAEPVVVAVGLGWGTALGSKRPWGIGPGSRRRSRRRPRRARCRRLRAAAGCRAACAPRRIAVNERWDPDRDRRSRGAGGGGLRGEVPRLLIPTRSPARIESRTSKVEVWLAPGVTVGPVPAPVMAVDQRLGLPDDAQRHRACLGDSDLDPPPDHDPAARCHQAARCRRGCRQGLLDDVQGFHKAGRAVCSLLPSRLLPIVTAPEAEVGTASASVSADRPSTLRRQSIIR